VLIAARHLVDRLRHVRSRADEVRACRERLAVAGDGATVEERVGPFRASFDWLIEVQEQEPMKRIAILARGKDAKLAATARAQMSVTLEEIVGRGSRLDVDADLQVTGKIASLGQVVLKRKSDQVVSQFAEALRLRLDGAKAGAADA